MPKTLREQLQTILARHIANAVDESIAAYRELIAAGIGDDAPRPRAGTRSTRAATKAPKKVRFCPVPGCGKPGKGPRFRFFCVDHRTLPRAEQEKILADAGKGAARRSAGAGKRGKKAAGKKGKNGVSRSRKKVEEKHAQ